MSEAIEAKARAYLAEGKITVTEVDPEHGTAVVRVQGTRAEPYRVRLQGYIWTCDCPARTVECAHIVASRLVVPMRARSEAWRVPGPVDDLEAFLASLGREGS